MPSAGGAARWTSACTRVLVAVKVASRTSWLATFQSPAASWTCGAMCVFGVAAAAGRPVAAAASTARTAMAGRRMTAPSWVVCPGVRRRAPGVTSPPWPKLLGRPTIYAMGTQDGGRARWQQRYDAARKRDADFTTLSGIEVEPVYGPADESSYPVTKAGGFERIGWPGEFP